MSRKYRKPPPPYKIREEDLPKVGDIWRLTISYADRVRTAHYLLMELLLRDEMIMQDDRQTFLMLELETGEQLAQYMNLELDDWHKIE